MKKEVAKILLESKAVSINLENPFTWASGIRSPIYCDNRVLISLPEQRKKIIDYFCKKIEKMNNVDIIAGTATAGIPHAAWIADRLNLPMIYVRSESKSHGRKKSIEGLMEVGKNVVLIEDLISTASSSVNAANEIVKAGSNVVKVLSIFNYNLKKSGENFKKSKLEYDSLSDIQALLELNEELQLLSPADCIKIKGFLRNI